MTQDTTSRTESPESSCKFPNFSCSQENYGSATVNISVLSSSTVPLTCRVRRMGSQTGSAGSAMEQLSDQMHNHFYLHYPHMHIFKVSALISDDNCNLKHGQV